jgi:hypothetical protein
MTRDEADTLVTALNTIDKQRKEQYRQQLTEAQRKADEAINALLEDEGFNILWDSIFGYSIISQRAEIYND